MTDKATGWRDMASAQLFDFCLQFGARVRELEDAAEAADRAEREAMDHAQYQSTVSA